MSDRKFKSRYQGFSLGLSIVDHYYAHSISMGYLRKKERLHFFVFGSSFYVELSGLPIKSEVNDEACTILLQFDGHRLYGASLQAVVFDKDSVVCSTREVVVFDRSFSSYNDTAAFALKLSPLELAALEFGGRLRLYFFSDSIQPNFITFSDLRILQTLCSVDTEYQMGDQGRTICGSSLRDGLSVHRQAGWSPLHFAAHWNHEDWVSAMLQDGVSPDVVEANGATALHRAADMGHLPIASILLRAGADPNPVDNNLQERPLDCAIRKGHLVVADLIRSFGGTTFVDVSASSAIPGPSTGKKIGRPRKARGGLDKRSIRGRPLAHD